MGTSSPLCECVFTLWVLGGGHYTRLRETGGGGVPIRTRAHTLWYSRFLCTLWPASNNAVSLLLITTILKPLMLLCPSLRTVFPCNLHFKGQYRETSCCARKIRTSGDFFQFSSSAFIPNFLCPGKVSKFNWIDYVQVLYIFAKNYVVCECLQMCLHTKVHIREHCSWIKNYILILNFKMFQK